MADKKVDVRFGEEVVGRTIVGGRNHATASGTVAIPVGIEKVLYLAASDSAFKARLLSRRDETLADAGLKLDPSERELLRAIPAEQLRSMIDRIDPRAHGNRRFMRSVAAATAALASTTAVLGCDLTAQSRGIAPDFPDADVQERVDAEVPMGWDAGGARPDEPDAGDAEEPTIPDAG